MITVEVVRVEGRQPPMPMAANFDEFGGTIGRGVDCTLILNDANRSVSRLHAKLDFDNGQYRITDHGTNPLRVNGSAVGKGNAVAIKSGDQITIGPFELEVRGGVTHVPTVTPVPMSAPAPRPASPPPAAPAAAASDPFADLLGGPRPGAGAASAPGSGDPFADLLGGAKDPDPSPSPAPAPPAAPSGASDPFADLGFSASGDATPAPSPSPSPASTPPSAIPDDFDFLAAPEPEKPQSGADDLSDDVFSGLGSSPDAPGKGSLDEMFGLSAGGNDPLHGSPLDKPASAPGSNDSGLTQWLGSPRKDTTADPVADQVPELNAPFQPPSPSPPPAPPREPPRVSRPATPAPAAPPPTPAAPAAGSPGAGPELDVDLDDLFGLDSGPAAADGLIPSSPAPTPTRVAPAPAAVPSPPPPPPPLPPAAPPSRPIAAPAPTASRPAAAVPADHAEMLEALNAGLAAQDLHIDALTPELMFRLGTLLHEATAGTIALLNARGTVKREMRADVTMIASGRNNPLKFSPDAKLALRYLFGDPMPGFMGAEEAMQDAYADLRSHEFGFMAGLRAALSGVLKRFDPAALEARVPERGGLAGLGGNRKAKLWDQFAEHYRQVATEAEEDFHALFGREFLRAYEEHVAALEAQRRAGRR